MLKKTTRVLPHGAILIANMFIAFYLIDRVNKAMNFIDNGLTKGLLLVMCAMALIDIPYALAGSGREARRILPLADGVLCAITLILMLVDLILPDASLFTGEFVKLVLLITCLATIACSVALIASRRRRLSRRRRRTRARGGLRGVLFVAQ